jgi:hypothetical protein
MRKFLTFLIAAGTANTGSLLMLNRRKCLAAISDIPRNRIAAKPINII